MLFFFLLLIFILFLIFFLSSYLPKTSPISFTPRENSPREIPEIVIADLEKINTSKWKTEGLCRIILEKIFDKKFPSTNPSFLKNPSTGRNLQLDCYNEQLKLALEYNGEQHYNFPNKFHHSKQDFDKQVHHDNLKKERCKEHRITLIVVPFTIRKKELVQYITEKLEQSGFISII